MASLPVSAISTNAVVFRLCPLVQSLHVGPTTRARQTERHMGPTFANLNSSSPEARTLGFTTYTDLKSHFCLSFLTDDMILARGHLDPPRQGIMRYAQYRCAGLGLYTLIRERSLRWSVSLSSLIVPLPRYPPLSFLCGESFAFTF